ncbi:MAG: hypothetical protein NTU93_09630 [Arthrobacter sp.]|nr:hypothetical protein [Arthrobacter sp.]
MIAAAGGQRSRAAAPRIALALALAVAALSGCEVADDVGLPAAGTSPSARPSAARPPLPASDPELAASVARNLAEVERILGDPAGAVLMGGGGGIGRSGFRSSSTSLGKGTYAVTVACSGTPSAFLIISQDSRRDGGHLELSLECGRVVEAAVDLESGLATVQIISNTMDPGLGGVAGFRIERRPPP